MKRLQLKKHKIAVINNTHLILGGGDNSNADTICNQNGNDSVTCLTNCQTCETTNANSPCTVTHPGTTRPNTSDKNTVTCLGLG
jgi:hypothetical protein